MNSRFATPPDDCRPLQFVPPFELWCGTDERAMRDGLQQLRNLGMTGLVVNVSLENYLRSEGAWENFRRGVRIACAMGTRVWIYDEKGYPSGAAGGLVLEDLPAGEAQGLLRSTRPDGQTHYQPVRLYEGTHATENFYQKRPYINILDPDAVSTFVRVTHEQYARILRPIGKHVEAFFTDEPSLIAAYVPKGKRYPPTLPWHPRLPGEFHLRKGYDLLPHLESLFRDTGEIDRKIRCDFYEVIADLCAETYFGRIQDWCRANSVLSSGHLLGEETLVWQTLFEGDPFACYRKLDIPGIDMILSDPGKIMTENYFLVPKLGSSAARLQGKKRVMCEISDFLGALDGRHATVDQMKCTAGLLTALGVTDFVSMYQPPVSSPPGLVNEHWPAPAPLSPSEFKEYADYAARVKAVFSEGEIVTRVAVLHPLLSVWAHFTPSDRSMYEPHPSGQVESFDRLFTGLCRDLLQHQMDFDIVDERSLAESRVEAGTLAIGGGQYEALVLPPMDTVRLTTMETIARFSAQGGAVFMHSPWPRFAAEGLEYDQKVRDLADVVRTGHRQSGAESRGPDVISSLKTLIASNCAFSPPSQQILCTKISRPEGEAYFLVNTSPEKYSGHCLFPAAGNAILLDPAAGESRDIARTVTGAGSTGIRLTMKPYETIFVVFQSRPLASGERAHQ